MNQVAAGLVAAADRYNVEALVGIESRGFIFGAWHLEVNYRWC